MATKWFVDRTPGLPLLVMRYDAERHLSQITGDGVRWVDSEIPHREITRGGTADWVTEDEARAVFGRLPDDMPAAS